MCSIEINELYTKFDFDQIFCTIFFIKRKKNGFRKWKRKENTKQNVHFSNDLKFDAENAKTMRTKQNERLQVYT